MHRTIVPAVHLQLHGYGVQAQLFELYAVVHAFPFHVVLSTTVPQALSITRPAMDIIAGCLTDTGVGLKVFKHNEPLCERCKA